MNGPQKLEKMGFESVAVGNWELDRGSVALSLYPQHGGDSNVIYAFVSPDEKIVKYVGMTTRTLEERMLEYESPNGCHEEEINENIRQTLYQKLGLEIKIYVLPSEKIIEFMKKKKIPLKKIEIVLKEIERKIIDNPAINPEWND